MLRVLDLFSGIGGVSLGLERTGGFETVAFCEIEEFPRRVLAKHWPGVPCYKDVRELNADQLRADGISVDVICGGFPCQDISTAGNGAGLAGERSGLWSEIARLVGELRPGHVIVENVAALLGRGLGTVLGDLAALGYDAEWHCIPASAIGAPHRRDRIWIVAYPNAPERGAVGGACDGLAFEPDGVLQRQEGSGGFGAGSEALAYSPGERWSQARQHSERPAQRLARSRPILADASVIDEQRFLSSIADPQEWGGPFAGQARSCGDGIGWWRTEPQLGRVAHGVPDRAHRLKGLGNAVVPQIPELIGRAILQSMEAAA
jgi:DNA (cytosine-5)-methyltransferase 1